MGRCQNKGCRKHSRHPTSMCSSHGKKGAVVEVNHGVAKKTLPSVTKKTLSSVKKNAASTKNKTLSPKGLVTATKKPGYFGRFVVSNKDLLQNISSYISASISSMEKDDLARGSRAFSYVEDGESLKPFLEQIVEEARQCISFPLSKSEVYANAAGISIAPPNSTRSNAWTCGAVHRDFNEVHQSGVYTFLLCVDEMTEENGAIRFWNGSKGCPVDKKNPTRGLQQMGLLPTTLVGAQGTVFVFDARLVHKPLPNKTDKQRILLGWQVAKPTVYLAKA
jgi:hypothetical protein